MIPHLRVARPTDDLEGMAQLYAEGLGLQVLASFRDHEGFDGVVLGNPAAGYHLELTRQRGRPAGGAPSAEHLLVFYHPDPDDWNARCRRAEAAGFIPVPAANPYWERVGRTYEDPDGYRIVLQNAGWSRSP